MGKSDKRIIVVHKNHLFGNGDFFEGFRPYDEVDYETRILQNMISMRRGSTDEPVDHPEGNAEMNPTYKQPIGYGVIANPEKGIVFAYQRSRKDASYSEKRLQGKWSWGAGGHIESHDGVKNPIRTSLVRELGEEFDISGNVKDPRVLGYIYHDFDVHQVHFGILYLIETDATQVLPRDGEAMIVQPKTIQELEAMCNSPDCDVEEWSKTALQVLKWG